MGIGEVFIAVTNLDGEVDVVDPSVEGRVVIVVVINVLGSLNARVVVECTVG